MCDVAIMLISERLHAETLPRSHSLVSRVTGNHVGFPAGVQISVSAPFGLLRFTNYSAPSLRLVEYFLMRGGRTTP